MSSGVLINSVINTAISVFFMERALLVVEFINARMTYRVKIAEIALIYKVRFVPLCWEFGTHQLWGDFFCDSISSSFCGTSVLSSYSVTQHIPARRQASRKEET